jgi:hypothetical protein
MHLAHADSIMVVHSTLTHKFITMHGRDLIARWAVAVAVDVDVLCCVVQLWVPRSVIDTDVVQCKCHCGHESLLLLSNSPKNVWPPCLPRKTQVKASFGRVHERARVVAMLSSGCPLARMAHAMLPGVRGTDAKSSY